MREEKQRPWGGDPMIVISLDAVGTEDLPFLKSLPNFGNFWREAAVCEERISQPHLSGPHHHRHGKISGKPWHCQQSADSAAAGETGLVLAEAVCEGGDPVRSRPGAGREDGRPFVAGDRKGEDPLEPAGGPPQPPVAESDHSVIFQRKSPL